MTLDEAQKLAEIISEVEGPRHLAQLLNERFHDFCWTVSMAGPHVVGVEVEELTEEVADHG